MPRTANAIVKAGYTDRADAGRALAESLARFVDAPDAILLALPRGGVPVAHEVARQLRLPLKLLLVRRIRLPGSELSIGSVSLQGIPVLSRDLLQLMKADDTDVDAAVRREVDALTADEARCTAPVKPSDVRDRTAIIIDDGLATGSSMCAGAKAVRAAGAVRVIAAAPVASSAALSLLEHVVDQIICPLVPDPFYAVSVWYDDFADVTDAEVESLLSS